MKTLLFLLLFPALAFSAVVTYTDGVTHRFNPNGTLAGLNVGAHTADPSSLNNGDIWYNSTSNLFKFRVNGATAAIPDQTSLDTALALKAPLASPTFTGSVTIPGGTITGITDLAVADGGTGLSSGTSGGILGYTASGTLASSAALGAGNILVGGGAGAVPTSVTAGETTTILVGGGAGTAPVWTTATGSGSPVRGTAPSLAAPVIQDSNAVTALTISATTTAVNYVDIKNAATGTTNMPVISTVGSDTNIPLCLFPKGSGAFILGPKPDGSATGGNARGGYATDLQITRAGATAVASGSYAFTAGYSNTASASNTTAIGYSNTASASYATAIGRSCVASGDYGVAMGYVANATAFYTHATGLQSLANHVGQEAHSAGAFAADGDAQYSNCISRVVTSAASLTEMFLDNSSAKITLVAGQTIGFRVTIVAKETGSANAGKFVRSGLIARNSSTTALVGSVATDGTDITTLTTGAPTIAVTADDTTDYLKLTVTPASATSTRWVARWELTEVTY